MNTRIALTVVFLFCSIATVAMAQPESNTAEAVEPAKVTKPSKGYGATRNVHRCGNVVFAGGFTEKDWNEIRQNQFDRVITLRTDGEVKWDEEGVVKKSNVEFVKIPFRKPDELTDEVFGKVRRLLADQDQKKTFLHCASANRVGAVWLPFRVLDEGVDFETALKEAKEVGLKSPAYEKKARDYIDRMLKKK